MKKLFTVICCTFFATALFAQPQTIVLNQPDLNRGLSVMQSFAQRSSQSKFDTLDLKIQDLSDLLWAAMDAGIVSQNIGIFCAGTGFATHPRVTMDPQKLREVLKLKPSQYLMLNNLVAYKKD